MFIDVKLKINLRLGGANKYFNLEKTFQEMECGNIYF